MESAFAIVLFVVVGVAAVAAVWALVTSGGSYDQIGGGRMSLDRQATAGRARGRDPPDAQGAQRRRAARGEAPLDVDAELRALATQADPELREEVRALVEARNARRVARGEEPLDVEAEIDRRLRELG